MESYSLLLPLSTRRILSKESTIRSNGRKQPTSTTVLPTVCLLSVHVIVSLSWLIWQRFIYVLFCGSDKKNETYSQLSLKWNRYEQQKEFSYRSHISKVLDTLYRTPLFNERSTWFYIVVFEILRKSKYKINVFYIRYIKTFRGKNRLA